MNLDDLKDNLASEGRALWEKIQDSAAFNQLRDRHENLTPPMQKLSVLGVMGLIIAFLLSVPYSNFNDSTNSVNDFEGKRSTIRELLKVSRESSDTPNIPPAPNAQVLRSRIDEEIKNARLLPEQIKGANASASKSQLIPDNLLEGALEVRLAKLNIRQIVDLGYKFQNVSPSVKMKDLVISANLEDNRYFDVIYQLVALAVPAPQEFPIEENTPNEKSGRNKKSLKQESEEK
jgi:hypothetical protein